MSQPEISLPGSIQFLRPFSAVMVVLISLTLGIPLLLTANPAIAQDQAEQRDNEPAFIDTTQTQVSVMVLDTATWVDNFFNDDRATSEKNKTWLTVGVSSGYSKNGSFEMKPDISGRIDLPHLSKKLNLLISASNDEDFATNQNPISASPHHLGLKDRSISTALQYFIEEGEKYNISALFGASFHYLYTGFRYRRLQEFGPWQGRLIERLQYYTDDGLENMISYDLERYFSNRWLLRNTVTADWYRQRHGLPHSLVFGLYQIISQKKAILYEVGNYFTTEGSYKMTDLQIRLRYRRRFLRDWLVLEVAPQITFPEDHDRKANPGLIIRFEANIGDLSGKDIFSEIFSF